MYSKKTILLLLLIGSILNSMGNSNSYYDLCGCPIRSICLALDTFYYNENQHLGPQVQKMTQYTERLESYSNTVVNTTAMASLSLGLEAIEDGDNLSKSLFASSLCITGLFYGVESIAQAVKEHAKNKLKTD